MMILKKRFTKTKENASVRLRLVQRLCVQSSVENQRKLFLLLKKLVNAEIVLEDCIVQYFYIWETNDIQFTEIGGSRKQTFAGFLEKKP